MANNHKRRGMSLLEVVVATSMLAMIMTTISVVMRTSRQAWEAHDADYQMIEAAHATLRHIVREVRQAERVTAISRADDTSGSIGLELPNGDIRVWDHDSNTNTVNCGIGAASWMLAPDIEQLRIVGYEADATTETEDDEALVQCVRIDVTVELDRDTNSTRTVSSWAWIRSW
jgi:type II secretory pathway pseudopilin PulG